MKTLKNFKQFVSESKLNESSTETAYVEENAFLIDGTVYTIDEIELEVAIGYERPDREVGLPGGYYSEAWKVIGLEGVNKATDPDLGNKLERISTEAQEISGIGFSGNAQGEIDSLVWEADLVEVTGDELSSLESKIIELDLSGQLQMADLTGNFIERCESSVESLIYNLDNNL